MLQDDWSHHGMVHSSPKLILKPLQLQSLCHGIPVVEYQVYIHSLDHEYYEPFHLGGCQCYLQMFTGMGLGKNKC